MDLIALVVCGIIWVWLACCVGTWAERWQRSPVAWLLLALLASPLLAAATLAACGRTLAAPEPGRTCPDCLSVVPLAARKCKYCGSDLPAVEQAAAAATQVAENDGSYAKGMVIAGALIVALAGLISSIK